MEANVKVLENTRKATSLAGRNYSVRIGYKDLVASVWKIVDGKKVHLLDLRFAGAVAGIRDGDDKRVFDCCSTVDKVDLAETDGGYSLTVTLAGDGELLSGKEVVFDFSPTFFTVRQVAEATGEFAIHEVRYGADAAGGQMQASTGSFEQLFAWDPDRYETIVPPGVDIDLRLGILYRTQFDSSYEEGFFKNDMGRYVFPPYVAAVRTAGEWFGVATMDLPDAGDGLRLHLRSDQLYVSFDVNGQLKAGPDRPYEAPRIGFFFGPGRDDILVGYAQALFDSGKAVRRTDWHGWWSGPIFCFFADQLYQYVADGKTFTRGEGEVLDYINDDFLAECTGIMDAHDIPWTAVIFDYGWFEHMGDWRPNPRTFKDLKKLIRDLHERGKRVLLWFAPHFVDMESDLAKQHPDWMVKDRSGEPLQRHLSWLMKDTYIPDYTHPKMREHAGAVMRYMISPQGLDADGLKYDCTHVGPSLDNTYHDPPWGIGERMQYKTMKLIYDAVKDAKHDALVENSSANPFYNDVQDLCRLNDASTYCSSIYEERAWVAWLAGANVCDTDDWSAFKKYFVRLNLKKAVFGTPTLYGVKWRGAGRRGGPPGGYPVPIEQGDYNRVSSIFNVYLHSPIDATQERFMDPDNKVYWRKFTSGRLAGFYSAAGLSGNDAIATYRDEAARICAIVDCPLVMPVPPGCKELTLAAVYRDGRRAAAAFTRRGDTIIFDAQSSAGDLSHYELKYSLP